MPKIQTRGRRPLPGLPREANGRVLRSERERLDREEANRKAAEDRRRRSEDLELIAAQPHRKGDATDHRLESPLGRFIASHRLRPEIHRGADAFADLIRKWRSARGVPTDIRIAGGGSGLGPSDEQVSKWAKRIERARAVILVDVMGGHGLTEVGAVAVYELVRAMVADSRDMMVLNPAPVITALRSMAVEMGKLDAGLHPYQAKAA